MSELQYREVKGYAAHAVSDNAHILQIYVIPITRAGTSYHIDTYKWCIGVIVL